MAAGVVAVLLVLVVIAVSAALPTTETLRSLSTPYLPFDLSTEPSAKKVLAHYMPNFPVSIDNKPSATDYYTAEYLSPTGEGGLHSSYGGYLRDRPLPRGPLADPDWRNLDLRTEISQAKSVGIDGFAVDVIMPRSPPSLWSDVPTRLLDTAAAQGNFTILPTADMAGPLQGMSARDLASEFAVYLRSPASFRLEDGRPVLGAFYAEAKPAQFWRDVLTALKDLIQLDVAFVPTFLDAPTHLSDFAPFSYGFSTWGGRNPEAVPTVPAGQSYPVDLTRRSHALGKIWMQSIAYQDSRPKSAQFEESQNGQTSRQAWQVAVQEQADWVQLVTWNDYSENTQFAPSLKSGWRLLDMNAYFISLFKYGAAPEIVRDAVYVSYRTQPADAPMTYPESRPMRVVPGTPAARDSVELVSFAVAPSTLRLHIGPETASCDVPAGVGVCQFALRPGLIRASMWRGGNCVFTTMSTIPVTTAPLVQDLHYVLVGGLR
ncbi:glycoside hydrolase family 71 protein [Mycolicibacterium rufum]|uniref:Glycoside hydrolase family 71 protein n=1 Tax=Mycolicibacterium rufum TaxID=318424 RepID=A0A9X2YGE1_9MYCO|nr:glycoside hydrolase family 71 protein [Mycolicibacterium rufum]MCV7073462.1 hypothetical protein [Mycolicibacterium rufum]ULP38227.2 glycoside hydrolase family 71 protein [Mycolicibacterium rufum]